MSEHSPSTSPLRLGARGSMLSRTQSKIVADAIVAAHPGLQVEFVAFKTSGDVITDRPLHEVGGKGLFTRELEQALLAGTVDFAVHSYKDVPVTMPLVDSTDLIMAATPARVDARDVLIARGGERRIIDLPSGARIGTGSLRRACQLLSLRPDLRIEAIRGNIDTRLRKLREGQYDAVILAMAGLLRAGLFDASTMSALEETELLPAPGQGALALQCRRNDAATQKILGAINDADTSACVAAERELVRLLRGDCLSPIAAVARRSGGAIEMKAAVGARGGVPPLLRASARDLDPLLVAGKVFQLLDAHGVMRQLHGA